MSSQIPEFLTRVRDPDSIEEQVIRMARLLASRISFGSPQDPTDPASTTLASGAVGEHSGTPGQMAGVWYTLSMEATGTMDFTCVHNLDLEPVDSSTPNVTWMEFGRSHDGQNGDGTSFIRLNIWYEGGTVTKDSIVLRVNIVRGGSGTLYTIDASHPFNVHLYVMPGVR